MLSKMLSLKLLNCLKQGRLKMWKFIWYVLGFLPKAVKKFIDMRRRNYVRSIDKGVDGRNDKSVNDKLRDIVKKSQDRRDANS